MRLLIINGPNLNLLGSRETDVYGSTSFDDYFVELQFKFRDVELAYVQTNIEGEIIDHLHSAKDKMFEGIILNAGGYTHTSVAIGDAVAAIKTPVAEVHISNVMDREEFRHTSHISKYCIGTISGFGLEGYLLAVQNFMNK